MLVTASTSSREVWPDLTFKQARLTQVEHPFTPRLVGDIGFISALEDDAGHFVGNGHHLIDAQPSLVAGAAADIAANRL
jgi:hypothetical protein